MTEKKSEATETVEVTFKAPHNHGGKLYSPGDTAQVIPNARSKLLKIDVIKG